MRDVNEKSLDPAKQNEQVSMGGNDTGFGQLRRGNFSGRVLRNRSIDAETTCVIVTTDKRERR
jgi:hypothetical protein